MPLTRILLSIEPRLHAELLRNALASVPGIELVGETTETHECLQLVAASYPDFWIHSQPEGPELEALLSQLYASHPGLSVIRIHPQEATGYIQQPVRSLSELLAFVTQPRGLVASA